MDGNNDRPIVLPHIHCKNTMSESHIQQEKSENDGPANRTPFFKSWLCRVNVLVKSITVEPVLFLYMTAAFLSFPTFQYLLYDKICYDKYGHQANYSYICNNLNNETVTIERNYVQGHTSLWILYVTLCYTFPSIISASFVGSWSDYYGKKVVMILPFIGGICEKIFGLFGAVYIKEIPVWAFLFGALLAGSTGNFAVAIQTVFSYISDITSTENRSIRVAMLESMTFFGALVGSILISSLLGKIATYQLYILMLALYISGCIYIIVRIRNVIPPQVGSEENEHKSLFSLHHIKQSLSSALKYREDGKRTDVLLVILAMCLYVVAAAGERDVSYLFLINRPLQWSPNEYGYYQFYYYALLSISLMVFLPVLRKYLHIHDLTIAIIGGLSKCAFFIILSLSIHTWMVYTAVSVGALSLMAPSSVRTVLSKLGSASEQGKLFAVLASLESLSGVIATSIFNPVYKASLPKWSGLSFAICAVVVLIMLLIISYLRYRLKNITSDHEFENLVEDRADET